MGSGFAGLGLGFGEVTLKHDDNYKFMGRVVMEIENFNDQGKSDGKILYTILYNNSNMNSAIEFKDADQQKNDGTVLFVFDQVNKCLFMLSESDGSKSGMIMAITDEPATAATDVKAEDIEFDDTYMGIYKKTGKSKTIAGYKCDEYLAADPEGETETSMWMTRDTKLNVNRKGLATAGLPAWYSSSALYGGYMMEMESREKGRVTSKMVTKEINDNVNTDISIKEYELVQMNAKM